MNDINNMTSEEWNGCKLVHLYANERPFRLATDAVMETPPLHFKPEWDVYVTPPFANAMMRFQVRHNGKYISVYCDFFNTLGYMSGPYWEIYPRTYAHDAEGNEYVDVQRFMLNDTEAMMKAIDDELNGIKA